MKYMKDVASNFQYFSSFLFTADKNMKAPRFTYQEVFQRKENDRRKRLIQACLALYDVIIIAICT
jgi:hypothetical protein